MVKILPKKQLEAAWHILKAEVLSRPVFADTSEKAKEARKKRCEDNVAEFGRTYFPEYVSSESAPFHKEWEDIRRIEKEPVLL
jgi:hypothetical protein